MPEETSSGTTAKKKRAVKRPAAKKPSSRKRAVKPSAAPEPTAAPAASATPAAEDRLKEVARTIGTTVGGIVAKTKKALKRDSGQK